MKVQLKHFCGVALRLAIAAACCAAVWHCWKLARADYLYRLDTEDSVRAAIGLVPDGWGYYLRLAQLDRAHAKDLLNTALRLDRYDAMADIELALDDEADENYAEAERLLLNAYEIDRTYEPRWSLANFYLRRENLPAFWRWARSAAAMPAEDIRPLFELCWRVAPDADTIAANVLNDQPGVVRQYLQFLMDKEQRAAVGRLSARLLAVGDAATDQPLLFQVINNLIAGNEGAAATQLWQSLLQKKWVAADSTLPNNAQFARAPLPVGFDWSLPEYTGLHSWPGAGGLEVELTGSEPENCVIAEQTVALKPGSYAFSTTYRSTDIRPETGIRWQIADAKSGAILAESQDLSSETFNGVGTSTGMGFEIPEGPNLYRLRLAYQRRLGTTRVSGNLVILSTSIRPQTQS